MNGEPNLHRRDTRDDGIYNALIDAEQEIWNRGASVRADRARRIHQTWLGRLFRWLWFAGCEVVDLEFGCDKCCSAQPGAYADVELTNPLDHRTVRKRERYRIIGRPHHIDDETIVYRAQRIEAPDYAVTQNVRAARLVVIVAAIHIVVMVYLNGCLPGA